MVIASCDGDVSSPGEPAYCEASGLADEAACLQAGGNIFWDSRCWLFRQSSYLLFSEVPIELADFHAELKAVTGLRLSLDRADGASILVEKVFGLRSLAN